MNDLVVGSKMKAEAFTGQNGGLNPSVQYPGDKPLPRSTIAQSIMKENKAKAPNPDAPDWQTRPVSADAGVAVHPSMAKRAADAGSPGGKVTGSSSRAPDHGSPGGRVPSSLNYKR